MVEEILKIVKIRASLHWGFILRQPIFTAAQPSIKYPSLTSIIGALSYGYAKLMNLPEVTIINNGIYSTAAKLLAKCNWVTYSIKLPSAELGVIETRDINKVSLILGIRRENIYPGSIYLWGIQVHGKVYLPNTPITITIFPKEDSITEIAKASWLMIRLGARESPISVDEVRILSLRDTVSERIKTKFIFPSELAVKVHGLYDEVELPYPNMEWWSLGAVKDPRKYLRKFIIPKEEVNVELKKGYSQLYVDGEGDYYIVPVRTW